MIIEFDSRFMNTNHIIEIKKHKEKKEVSVPGLEESDPKPLKMHFGISLVMHCIGETRIEWFEKEEEREHRFHKITEIIDGKSNPKYK